MIEVDFNDVESLDIFEKHSKKRYSREYIDKLLDQASFEDVLNYYNLEVKPQNKGELLIYCPFHNDGKTPNCFINPQKNAYFCFSCGQKGTLLNFVIEIEKQSGNNSFSDCITKLSKISGFEDMDDGDSLDYELDKFIRTKKVVEENILGMSYDDFNITLSSIIGDYLTKNPNDIAYVENIYSKMDEYIKDKNSNRLINIFKKAPSKLKERRSNINA